MISNADRAHPDFSELIKAVLPGGLPESILAFLSEWYKRWSAPQVEAGFLATWHEPPCRVQQCKWRGTITYLETQNDQVDLY